MLVARCPRALEPVRQRRVQPTASRLRDARVRHLARQRVLDRVLALARHRRAAARCGRSRAPRGGRSRAPPRPGGGRPGDSRTRAPRRTAACSAAFSIGGSRSIRAASTACTVSGTEKPRRQLARRPALVACARGRRRRRAQPTSSSTKNGLPSARSTTSLRSSSGRSTASSSSSMRAVASAGSGSSQIVVAFRRPRAPGRTAVERARDAPSRGRSDGPWASRTTRSRRSRRSSSAQWTSSTRNTAGRSACSSSTNSTTASWRRSRASSGCRSRRRRGRARAPRISRPASRCTISSGVCALEDAEVLPQDLRRAAST